MRRNLAFAYSLLTLSVAALAFAFYPLFVIYPFREQRPAPLMRALWVITHERLPLLAVFLVVLLCTVVAWRGARRAVKIFLLAPAAGIALLAFAAGCVNPFERFMFHGMGEPHFVTASQAHIDAKDMVIAVTLGGESRAYPIREMGYHHIVNDRLHQLPIVVTY